MSIQKIEQLREERKKFMAKYQADLKRVKDDNRISESYRKEQMDQIKANLNEVKFGHEKKIRELIEEGKNESLKKVEQAELEPLSEKELLAKLIIDNRNRDKAARLAEEHADNPEPLLSEARKALSRNSPETPAYVEAIREVCKNDPLRGIQAKEIDEEYQFANLNSAQRDHYRSYEAYTSQERLYRQETAEEKFTDGLGLRS